MDDNGEENEPVDDWSQLLETEVHSGYVRKRQVLPGVKAAVR